VCVCNLSYAACKAHALCYIAVCGLSGCTIFFPHYLINGTIFGKTLLNTKYVFWFSLQLLFETFDILRIRRDIIVNVHHKSPCKYPLFLSDFNKIWIFWTHFRKQEWQISNLIKMPPVGAEMFHSDGRTEGWTDRHEVNNRFSQFWVKRLKTALFKRWQTRKKVSLYQRRLRIEIWLTNPLDYVTALFTSLRWKLCRWHLERSHAERH
jgi:hypothetical protein